MTNKKFHIAVLGDSHQLGIVCRHLFSALSTANVHISCIQVESVEKPGLHSAFPQANTEFEAVFSKLIDSTPATLAYLEISTPSQQALKFNFADYGVPSSGVTFHQAHHIAQATDNRTPQLNQFLKKTREFSGVIYDSAQVDKIAKTTCIKHDIYNVFTSEISVVEKAGEICQIRTKEGQILTADLYIDCSTSQSIMRKLQHPITVDNFLVPAYEEKPKRSNASEGVEHKISVEDNRLFITKSNGSLTTSVEYSFSGDETPAQTTSFYFEQAWKANCVALGTGYCKFPETLISSDRILEIQLSHLAQLLPKGEKSLTAQRHLSTKSKEPLEEAIDVTNLLLFAGGVVDSLTETNKLRVGLFRSSAAHYQYENSIINNSCWGALMQSAGVMPSTANAIGIARPNKMVTEKVQQLATGN